MVTHYFALPSGLPWVATWKALTNNRSRRVTMASRQWSFSEGR